ncbi:MAG: hypothetical protein ACT4P7_15665 [Gemmatimonadaceae bacterium]
MALNFTKTNVTPGEPVTAQAWNAIVDGLFEVQAILSTGAGSVRVTVTGDQRDIDAALVVATDAAGVRHEAVRQASAGQPFVFPRLTAGAFTIAVSAPSCTTATASVTVAADGSATPDPVPVALAFTGRRMPNVLGQKWKDAVGALQAVSPRALDASGKGVPLTGFDAQYNDAPVLMQWPDPGEIVPAGQDPFVIIATIIKPAAIVSTPNVLGKTVAQATIELAKVGLQLKIV